MPEESLRNMFFAIHYFHLNLFSFSGSIIKYILEIRSRIKCKKMSLLVCQTVSFKVHQSGTKKEEQRNKTTKIRNDYIISVKCTNTGARQQLQHGIKARKKTNTIAETTFSLFLFPVYSKTYFFFKLLPMYQSVSIQIRVLTLNKRIDGQYGVIHILIQ